MNVQIVMERLGGGGHLTNAAAQLEGTVTEVAASALKQVLEEIEEGRGVIRMKVIFLQDVKGQGKKGRGKGGIRRVCAQFLIA